MTEQLISELLTECMREKIQFGSIEIKITLHDSRPVNTEVTVHRRRNLTSTKVSDHLKQDDSHGRRTETN